MIQGIYEFIFITIPWWGWYGLGVLSLVILFWPEKED